MTTLGRINLGTLVEKSGLGLEDFYMSRTDIWLCDGVDGHYYNSDSENMWETAWLSLDPQYGWMREEVEYGEMPDKTTRGVCLKDISDKYDIHDMWIVFLSDGKVEILIPDTAIIYSFKEELSILEME